jgi:hypothetical protein
VIVLAAPGRNETPIGHLIETTEVAFDDFAGSATDVERNRRILGLS